MTTIQMNCYYYPILLNNHAFEFLFNSHIECCPYCGSIHIVKAGKTVKEDNVINAIIVNEDSLIVQIIYCIGLIYQKNNGKSYSILH